ncbi:MAG: CotH kinase family protein [Lewinella sp.]
MRLLLAFTILVVGSDLSGQTYLTIDSLGAGLDTGAAFLLVQTDLDELAAVPDGLRVGDMAYSFHTTPESLSYRATYGAVSATGDSVNIAFTSLPLVQVKSFYELNNETKVPALISYADDQQRMSGTVGIEYRGGFSLGFPKKSLDLEFWNNATNRESVDVQFTGLREDDDWVLDALYNEPMRINAYVAHNLWLDWHTPYYADREPEARSGAGVRFVELFFMGAYHGVYLLSEQVDRKQLKLKKLKDDQLRGELYKGVSWSDATLFKGQPARPGRGEETYAGWELKHPDADDLIDWNPLYNMLGFVSTASDDEFTANIGDRFHLGNLIDYMLYINVAALFDNTGKNAYLARYDQPEPYFFVPWDLDGSFGNVYDGTRSDFGDIWLTNGLLDRLIALNPSNFNQNLCNRYQTLRSGLLATDSLLKRIDEAHRLLENNGVFEREGQRWKNTRYDAEEILYMKNFLTDRMTYLDDYACLLSSIPGDVGAGHFVQIFPNPAADYLTVRVGFLQPTPYRILDLAGRTVRSGQLQAAEEQLDLSGLRPGIYFMQIFDRVQRFVVVHTSPRK